MLYYNNTLLIGRTSKNENGISKSISDLRALIYKYRPWLFQFHEVKPQVNASRKIKHTLPQYINKQTYCNKTH